MPKMRRMVRVLLLVLLVATAAGTVQPRTAGTVAAATAKGVKNGWVITGGKRYYYKNGKKLKGLQKIKGYYYYFNSKGQALKGKQKIGSYWYYFDKYGRRQTSWQKIKGCWYYFGSNGRMVTGWKKLGGSKYYFTSSGKAATGKKTISNVKYTFNSKGKVLSSEKVKKVTYRALVLGESDYGRLRSLPAAANDAEAMARMLKKTGYSSVKTGINVKSTRVKKLISEAFAGADSDDVSLFYYSGHGREDGALLTVDYQGFDNCVDPGQLAAWLKRVPGKVVVILDCCYSGALIGKSADSGTVKANAGNFNKGVIGAFDQADYFTKSGELCSGKFYVLTACSMYQESLCNSNYSIFTYLLLNGVGFDYWNGTKKSLAFADADGNDVLTLSECRQYTYYATGTQSSQCYPEGSKLKLFRR